MKRRLLIFGMLVFLLLLQSSVIVEGLKIGNIKPDFVLLFIIYISLNSELTVAETTGFFSGILEDILSHTLMGINALSRTLLSFFLNNFKTRIYTEKMVSGIIVVFFSTLIIKIFYFFLTYVFVNKVNFYDLTLKIIFPESLYNSILSIIIFPIFHYIFVKRLWQKR